MFGTLRLEAKSEVDSSQRSMETEQVESGGVNDKELIDPNIAEPGEVVHKRLTTYSDENVFTLMDGETVSMKIKDNIAGVAE
ncbi:MAG: hypothetical protein KR126chlam3_00408, partial [Chlamydiae bacterium]|nr:hypothetical protein [Chlamydiota bacterium]